MCGEFILKKICLRTLRSRWPFRPGPGGRGVCAWCAWPAGQQAQHVGSVGIANTSRMPASRCRQCRHSLRESHTAVSLSACWLCRRESDACVDLSAPGLNCAGGICRLCRLCRQQSIAIPIYVITYVITYLFFFKYPKYTTNMTNI